MLAAVTRPTATGLLLPPAQDHEDAGCDMMRGCSQRVFARGAPPTQAACSTLQGTLSRARSVSGDAALRACVICRPSGIGSHDMDRHSCRGFPLETLTPLAALLPSQGCSCHGAIASTVFTDPKALSLAAVSIVTATGLAPIGRSLCLKRNFRNSLRNVRPRYWVH